MRMDEVPSVFIDVYEPKRYVLLPWRGQFRDEPFDHYVADAFWMVGISSWVDWHRLRWIPPVTGDDPPNPDLVMAGDRPAGNGMGR